MTTGRARRVLRQSDPPCGFFFDADHFGAPVEEGERSSSTMNDFFENARNGSQIVLNIIYGIAVLKAVTYFVSKDKDSQADLCEKWNTGTNILIGHQGGAKSVVKSLIDEDDKSINESTFNKVDRRFREIKEKFGPEAEVHLHLRTPGGELFFAMLIAHIVNDWKGKVVAHIHSYSASGGTIIALACAEVHMDSLSVLGPIDPQVPKQTTHYSLTGYLASVGIELDQLDENLDARKHFLDIRHCTETKNSTSDKTDDSVANQTGQSGSSQTLSPQKYEKMLEINMRTANSLDLLRTYKKFLERILKRQYSDENVAQIINFFWIGRAHSSPIWRTECKQVGLNVVFVEEENAH